MSDIMRNPVSIDSSSLPAVYAPHALVPANQFGSEGFNARSGAGFSNASADSSAASYTTTASASFAEPMAFGDNDGQMAGFVSYLNNGPAMHTESGRLDNLSALFG